MAATIMELADGVAAALGDPAPTTREIARRLRAVSLIRSSGRGPSAAKMAAADAANLLIASCAALRVRDVTDAVVQFRQLQVQPPACPDCGWEEFQFLEQDEFTFGEVVDHLLDMAASGALRDAIARHIVDLNYTHGKAMPEALLESAIRSGMFVSLRVDMHLPGGSARIRVGFADGDGMRLVHDRTFIIDVYGDGGQERLEHAWRQIDASGKSITVSFNQAPLLSIGKLLAGEAASSSRR